MPFTITIFATILLYTWVLEPRGVRGRRPGCGRPRRHAPEQHPVRRVGTRPAGAAAGVARRGDLYRCGRPGRPGCRSGDRHAPRSTGLPGQPGRTDSLGWGSAVDPPNGRASRGAASPAASSCCRRRLRAVRARAHAEHFLMLMTASARLAGARFTRGFRTSCRSRSRMRSARSRCCMRSATTSPGGCASGRRP